MENNENKKKSRSFRATEEEWLKINKQAERANITVSEYIRYAALSESKVIFIEDGADIAKLLSELRILLDEVKAEGKIESIDHQKWMHKLDEISLKLSQVLSKIDEITAGEDTEEGGEE